jgi:hypothetical protein
MPQASEEFGVFWSSASEFTRESSLLPVGNVKIENLLAPDSEIADPGIDA